MTKAENRYEKDLIKKRVCEIITDYLYDEDESYAYITLYFEKSNGENQHKVLRFGQPSDATPDMCRDYPAGYKCDDSTGLLFDGPFPRIVWETIDGKEWKPDA